MKMPHPSLIHLNKLPKEELAAALTCAMDTGWEFVST